jgi:hypothetical protein
VWPVYRTWACFVAVCCHLQYEAVRRWITQHGTDPTTCEPLSILDLHPNLLLREMVEKWLAGADPLADPEP